MDEQSNGSSKGRRELVIRFKRQVYYDDEQSYHAEIIRSPIPLLGGDFRADIDVELTAFGASFENLLGVGQYYPYEDPPKVGHPLLDAANKNLEELGTKLHDLLPLSFRDGLLRWIDLSYRQGQRVRLVLEAQLGDKAERLLALPWELLFSPEASLQPARSPRFSIERRLIGAPLRSPSAMRGPLRLLHLIAEEESDDTLSVLAAQEQDLLPEAVGKEYYLLAAEPGSVEALRSAQLAHPAHILHFLGHGQAANTEDGALIRSHLRFVSEDRRIQHVTSEQLQILLQDAPALQMVVLTACDTGTATSGNIAYDLIASGFPYVVAMQGKLPAPSASHFIRRFYREIQQGQPPDVAVAAGRHEIAAQFPGSLDWCLPVLYSGTGLSPRPTLQTWIDAVNRWLLPAAFQRPWLLFGGMGAAHLLIALLLWLSGVILPPPDSLFLLKAFAWLVPASLLISIWFVSKSEIPGRSDLPKQTRGTFFLRVWGAVATGVGLSAFFAGYFVVALLAGLGFWSLLTPAAHWILLLPVLLISFLLGLAQAHNHGLGFLNSHRIQSIPFVMSDMFFVLVGSLFVVAPAILTYFVPEILAPPMLNLWIGVVNAIFAFILGRESVQKRLNGS